MDQDYPFNGATPGVNPTIYYDPSSLPRALGKLPGNILPKDIKFFFLSSVAQAELLKMQKKRSRRLATVFVFY
jgi:hypothetical protein